MLTTFFLTATAAITGNEIKNPLTKDHFILLCVDSKKKAAYRLETDPLEGLLTNDLSYQGKASSASIRGWNPAL